MTLTYLNDVSYHKRITRPDLVHHFIGNGLVQAVIQITENPSARNAIVLHLMNPDHFANRHKSDSYTFHQQLGPELTCVGVLTEGQFYLPNPRQTASDLQYELTFDEGGPAFRATYPLDFTLDGTRAKSALNVVDELFCPAEAAAVVRRFTVSNKRGLGPAPARVFAFLIPNQALFPEAHFNTQTQAAVAGYFKEGTEYVGFAARENSSGHAVAEFPLPFEALTSGTFAGFQPQADDDQFVRPRQTYTNYPLLPGSPHVGAVMALEFDLGRLQPGEQKSVELIYSIGETEAQVFQTITQLRSGNFDKLRTQAQSYWNGLNRIHWNHKGLDQLYRAAQSGLKASVSSTGRMNAGIWGYGAEWVRDSSMACVGVILSGQFELARTMLVHLIEDMISPEGMAFGEGQFYEIQRAELDQNGEILHAIWTYWVHSRDESLFRDHWERIVQIAEFPLRPEFWVEAVSMVKGERDVRERDRERHGLLPGFELAHQIWVFLGLRAAADMARVMGDNALVERWAGLSQRIWDSVISHPTHSLVDNGYFVKRRLLDGTLQLTAQARPYVHRPTEEPLTKMYPRSLNRNGSLEPDAFEALPIVCGLADPDSALTRRTLIRMEQLWNQEWDFGGYPLHHVGSEPTKLGAWPMSFYLITQAAVEARDYETVRRNLNWYLNTKDGKGFMWWEYRDVDPALQIDHGVIPWLIYGEPVILQVHHLLGYRPLADKLTIRPHLLPEMQEVQAEFRFGAHRINLHIHRGGERRALVNGAEQLFAGGDVLVLPLPTQNTAIELWLEADSI